MPEENKKEAMLTAEEARALTNLRRPTIEDVLRSIRSHAEQGYSLVVMYNAHPEVVPELKRLGYHAIQSCDSSGSDYVRIEW